MLTRGREFALQTVKFLAQDLKRPKKVYAFTHPGLNELLEECDAGLRRLNIRTLKGWGEISRDYKNLIDKLK